MKSFWSEGDPKIEVADVWEELLPETDENKEHNKFTVECMDTAVETWKYEYSNHHEEKQGK